MTGYTRSYNKSTGNTIEASDFNSEFQAIDDAFDASSGHTHDGTSGNGAYVPKIYDSAGKDGIETDGVSHEIDFNINVSGTKTRQIYLADGVLAPNTDSDIDLGTATERFATIYADAIDAGTVGVGGNAVLDVSDIGASVQAYDAALDNLAALTPTDKGVVIGNGSAFVVESGSTLRTSIGAQEALSVVSQAEAEAGVSTTARLWTAERVAQAIAELTPPAGTTDIAAAIFAASSKATPVDADTIGITDSAASNGLKKLTWANLKATIWSSFGALINGGSEKSTPANNDLFVIADSAASNATKKVSWGNIKTALGLNEMASRARASVAQIQGFTGDVGITAERLATAAAVAAPSGSSNWTPDWSSFISAEYNMTADRTINNPTGVIPGTTRVIDLGSSSSTPRTPSWGSNFKNAPTNPVSATARMLVTVYAKSATVLICSGVEYTV